MKRSIFIKHALPFIQWYTLMIFITIAIDYFLHKFQLVLNGSYLGFTGTFVIILSFIYSLKKRKILKSGSSKKLLNLHEYLAWAGSIMLLVHAGIHFNAILPWLAILMLLITVASGLVGKYLLKKSNENLKQKRQFLIAEGMDKEEADKKLFMDSITVDLMKKWRVIHLPITLLLVIFSLIHIVTIIIFNT
ncbi:MAG: hypothetical protein A3F91_02490 [Flavobacteria bacterium RIFCSPLOWO2_12_FULL_35_11]|nr:MAG: hypothetical protein A3F91_02490 [Flavobacteria bacterium RIFCSPLOWO2_12_FULL_35_11]